MMDVDGDEAAAAAAKSSCSVPQMMNLDEKDETGDTDTPLLSQNSPKRLKKHPAPMDDEVVYPPPSFPRPTGDVLEHLYENAMKLEEGGKYHQKNLSKVGILSLEEVLLPAAAHVHERALKSLQSVVQRDTPDVKDEIVACRKKIYRSVKSARKAVEQERERRAAEKAETERKRALELQQRRPERIRALRKKHPANQAIWRETAFLMNELAQLNIEEEKWKRASAELDTYEASSVAGISTTDQSSLSSPTKEDSPEHSPLENFQNVTKEMKALATQIEDGLRSLQEAAKEAEENRRELYDVYASDHQFHGYQGIKDLKGLVQSLSQSQGDYDDGF